MHVVDAISRGQLLRYSWTQDAVADSQSAVAMNTVEVTAGAALTQTEYVIPFEYDIVAIAIRSDLDRTAGTLTVDATVNGTAQTAQAALNATVVNSAYTRFPRSTKRGAAGTRLGVKLTTASWTPVAADVGVDVYVIVRLDGI